MDIHWLHYYKFYRMQGIKNLSSSARQPLRKNSSVNAHVRMTPIRRPQTGLRALDSSASDALLVGDLPSQLILTAGGNTVPLAIGTGVSLLAVLGLRAYAYFQIQYVTVSMMGRYMPGQRPDLRFLQLGGSSRDLFYYPTATALVIFQDPGANESLMRQAGIQAGVDVDVKTNAYDDLAWRPASSLDGVFANNVIGKASDPSKLLRELYRVLKPGAPVVFVQRLRGPALQALSGGEGAVDTEVLNAAITQDAWTLCQYDTALAAVDPHAVGLLVKPLPEDLEAAQKLQSKKAAGVGAPKPPKKGFN